MIPSTTKRVPEHTADHVNKNIRRRTRGQVIRHAASGKQSIDRRLNELDREWDIERTLEANAAAVSLLGVTLGVLRSRTWFLLPGVVAGFLLQHAIQGWCPPLPIFRRLGFRTASEIDHERYALKAARGDFRSVSRKTRTRAPQNAERILQAVEH